MTKYIPNPIPAMSDEYLNNMKLRRHDLTSLQFRAYPEAYTESVSGMIEPNKNLRSTPKLSKDWTVKDLEGFIDDLFDPEQLNQLSEEKSRLRLYLQTTGLDMVMHYVYPQVMQKPDRSSKELVRYSLISGGRCLDCMDGNGPKRGFKSQRFNIGEPRSLYGWVNHWKELLITDNKLVDDLERYTPECENHPKGNIYQIWTVHRFEWVAKEKNGWNVIPNSRGFDARIKSGFEEAHKTVAWLVGLKRNIVDAVGWRGRVSEEDYAQTLVRLFHQYPIQIDWEGTLTAQNSPYIISETDRVKHITLEEWLNGMLEKSGNADLMGYFNRRLRDVIEFEHRNIKIKEKGIIVNPWYGETIFPLSGNSTIEGANPINGLLYTPEQFQLIWSTDGHDALSYEERREKARYDTWTYSMWYIANLLKDFFVISHRLDYADEIISRRLKEARVRESEIQKKKRN